MPDAPDNGQVITSAAETVVPPTPEQIQNQIGMAVAFDDPSLLPPESVPATPDTPIVSDPAAPIVAPPSPDISALLKENFGLETLDEVKAKWAELQTTPAAPEIKYENEDSKLVAQALQAGKMDEAFAIWEKQKNISALVEGDITKDNAPNIVKAAMAEKYKGLTKEQINYKFNKQFAIPSKPEEDDFTTTPEYEIAENEWKQKVSDVEMDLIIEANLARPELAKIKTELKFPEIQNTNVDKEYEAWKASNAGTSEKIDSVLVPAIKALKEIDVPLGFKVDDANNQMQFDITLNPTADDFEKARQDSLNFDNFINRVGYDKDGNFLAANVQRLVLLYDNFGNYAQSIARQAVNEERKRVIAKEAPNNNGGGRDFNTNIDKTELQKSMEYALS